MIEDHPSVRLTGADGHIRPLLHLQAEILRCAVFHYGGRMTEAARRLKIGRSTIYRLAELQDARAARPPKKDA